jgi:hypothetical protein
VIVVGVRSAEECYRNLRRYSAGVMPVARRNARVKLDCEKNLQSRAISQSVVTLTRGKLFNRY